MAEAAIERSGGGRTDLRPVFLSSPPFFTSQPKLTHAATDDATPARTSGGLLDLPIMLRTGFLRKVAEGWVPRAIAFCSA